MIARWPRPSAGFLAAGLVVVTGAAVSACGDDGGGEPPPEAFFAGLHDELVEQGLSDDLADCFVDAVREVGPTSDDVTHFEEHEEFPAPLAAALDDRTAACLEAGGTP